MRFRSVYLPVVAGVVTSSIFLPFLAKAQSSLEVSNEAYSVTVRINGTTATSGGSGVIYDKQGSTYHVLTANHVFKEDVSYEVVTSDGRHHSIEVDRVIPYQDIDIAEFTFVSDESYEVAQIGDSTRLVPGAPVFVSGWAEETNTVRERAFIFSEGTLNTLLQNPQEGYSLLYSNNTRQGMSGGPVFDEFGSLVGIHGEADIDGQAGQIGVLGVPINLIFNTRLSSELFDSSNVRPEPNLSATSTAFERIQSRDFSAAIIALNRVVQQAPNDSSAYAERAWARFGLYRQGTNTHGYVYDPSALELIRLDLDQALQLDAQNVPANLLDFLYRRVNDLLIVDIGQRRDDPTVMNILASINRIGLSELESHDRYNAYLLHLKYSINSKFALSNAIETNAFDEEFHQEFVRDSEHLLRILNQISSSGESQIPFPLNQLSGNSGAGVPFPFQMDYIDRDLGDMTERVSNVLQGVTGCRELATLAFEYANRENVLFVSQEQYFLAGLERFPSSQSQDTVRRCKELIPVPFGMERFIFENP